MMQEPQKGFFDSMNSKAAFVFGIVSGVAVAAVLSVVALIGGGFPLAATSVEAETAVATTGEDSTTPTAAPAAARSSGSVPAVTDEDHVRGDKDAPLTWIEYSDFECPFCKRFAPTMEQMLEEYDGQIKLVYRHFPLSFHNPLATTQAEAVECANEFKGEDAFWKMHDFIFDTTSSNGNGMEEEELVEFATTLGIGQSEFQTCLDDNRYEDHIASDAQGGASAGVTGTPGSFLVDADGNAQLISGALPYSSIKAAIEEALK